MVRGGSGSPDAQALAGALAAFFASGAPRAIDQILQLKVSLFWWRPPIWRRVLPATASLADLHQAIQVLPIRDYPICTAFKGDSPVEYWSEDEPIDPEPFDLATVNRRLHAPEKDEQ